MICGLIGYPLGHSYSPQIHRALADYDYRLWPLKPEELEPFFARRDFAGINVTIPYKERVIPYLDQLSDTARAIGAVNTVVNRDGKLYGDNTDLAGILALIRRMGLVLSGKKVLILGTGGTSKTARAAASQLGAAEVYRVSRSGRDGAVTYRQAEEEHRDAACIINTTPCGMYPDLGGCPVELDGFPCLEGVVDVIYNPLRSELVLGARQRGIPAEGGLYMLAAQAAYASALFRGCEATEGDIELAYRTVLHRMENIVLIGMPSSGKTTVGRLLAQRTGKEFVDTDALVEQANRAGYQIASHAIGSRAIRRLTEALDKVTPNGLHRIEHCEFPDEQTAARLESGAYALVMQPGYSWIDKRYLHTYRDFLPEQVLSNMKLRSFYEKGVCLCGSSDSPVQELDPWLQMLGMVHFYVESESITVEQAFRCYTANAARAIREERLRGTLEVGKAADFFTAGEDLFSLPPERVVAFRPEQTFYGGKPFRRKKGTLGELLAMLLTKPKKI